MGAVTVGPIGKPPKKTCSQKGDARKFPSPCPNSGHFWAEITILEDEKRPGDARETKTEPNPKGETIRLRRNLSIQRERRGPFFRPTCFVLRSEWPEGRGIFWNIAAPNRAGLLWEIERGNVPIGLPLPPAPRGPRNPLESLRIGQKAKMRRQGQILSP